MGTSQFIAISNPNASNAQVAIWETNAIVKKDLVTCDVSLWWKSSCELQGMYGLQSPTKKTYPPLRLKQCTHPTQIKHTLHTCRCRNAMRQPRKCCEALEFWFSKLIQPELLQWLVGSCLRWPGDCYCTGTVGLTRSMRHALQWSSM
jgi:hypothetical protein